MVVCVLALCSYPDCLAVPDLQFESFFMTTLIQLAMHSAGKKNQQL